MPFGVTNLVPTQNLRSVIGIDLLLFLIDWYEGGDVQSAKKIGALCGNSPQEMVLSTGRHFVLTQILITVICIGLIFLP